MASWHHLVLASTTSARTAGAVLALFGFHAIVWGTVSASLRQELVPENLMGRINSVYLLFDAGSASIGALLGGLIASGFGLTAPFWLAASLRFLPATRWLCVASAMTSCGLGFAVCQTRSKIEVLLARLPLAHFTRLPSSMVFGAIRPLAWRRGIRWPIFP
jgi:hypothetical protein